MTGDTKVVERGKGDQIYINTSGIGIVHEKANIKIQNIQENDVIIINVPIASHGMAIMSGREGLEFESDILSDTINLNHIVLDLIEKFGDKIHFVRDATRGGLTSVLHEIATEINLGVFLFEDKIKVENQVKSACEVLGLDPLYVSNEGIFVYVAAPEIKDEVLTILQKVNSNASAIGFVTDEYLSKIIIESSFGGKRVVNPLVDEQLPRIC
ncbi:Carbamoyl dehydratase HypE [Flavobacterium bizetiae]|uniref:Carbamoyl dehydratase HypE n=1 Tax=Flavobacterium bizetiae TaxID=2704140 RepID=A0A6J4GPP5_9FLAO|nr:AIR synthase-related protein [Flavobacterium bizetiae]CAA9199490.1 Carbamoyl dehydratase HypE [Flavobacterium bizetiae]CAD5341240.1 Carbamoyl dehydratase HypE [Flavobacterium bizetiae]CAD5349038.1 Carbamoyl dehydratase HypE [Flavobacterium bizetiae]